MAGGYAAQYLPQTVFGLPTPLDDTNFASHGEPGIQMGAEQPRHAPGTGLLTPGVVDGRAAKQKAKPISRKTSARKSPSSSHTVAESPSSMNGEDKSPGGGGGSGSAEVATTTAKPKRVRTGCLTCRSRHLKCDEGTPICLNCRKSHRECERGIRLNFIDTTTPKAPIYLIPPTHDWQVTFQDESREIADEYKGGLAKYAPLEKEDQYDVPAEITYIRMNATKQSHGTMVEHPCHDGGSLDEPHLRERGFH